MSEIKDDLLRGGQAIADYIGVSYHQAYRMIQAKQIPAGKVGDLLLGSKRRIAAALDRITEGRAV